MRDLLDMTPAFQWTTVDERLVLLAARAREVAKDWKTGDPWTLAGIERLVDEARRIAESTDT